MRVSTAVPLAVGTALLTLLSSGYLLGQSTGSNGSTLVVEGSDVADLDLGGHEPPAVVATKPSSPLPAANGVSAAVPAPPVDAGPASKLQPAADQPTATETLPADYYEGDFLVAQIEPVPAGGETRHLRTLLKSLLGMAQLLKRTLVLPAALCNCKGANLDQCEGEALGPPFECPLRVALHAERWQETSVVRFRSARFMLRREQWPTEIKRSHVRLLLPDGMDDSELSFALRNYQSGHAGATRLLEIETAGKAFCGWDTRMPGNAERMATFTRVADGLLETAAGDPAVPLHHCTHYRGGTGEVLQFMNVGQADEKHVVTASRSKLPPQLRALPKDTDLMVTFATGSVATMACNWVKTTRAAGVTTEVLIGALDQQMMDMCAKHDVPCILIDGGEITKQLAERKSGNVRNDAAIYPKMSVLKVGFYHELLSFGFNVWACDADAVFVNDPRPMMRQAPWTEADIAIATDCIDLPSDARYPLLHCDFNTGLVYLRARDTVLAFVERWRDTVANAKEARIRDQAAFNMLTKAKPLAQYKRDGSWLKRIFTTTISGIGELKLGVLPLAQYLNGHTYFVQHAHTLPNAATPISVHMTYQFAEGSKFAYGKRQRLREAGLWLVDEDSYYNGRYVTASSLGANLPVKAMGPNVDSRDAVKYHLEEATRRAKIIRALLGIAKATGRDIILPRMLCYCDFMWKEMRNCRVGGAETMRLPFDCPMDHVLDTPRFFENSFGVGVREANFLRNPRVPANVSSSVAKVKLARGMNDVEVQAALRPHAHMAILEIEDAVDTFCGFADPTMDAAYKKEGQQLLSYTRTPFCMMEGSNNAPLFSQCCSPRKPGDKFFPCISGTMPTGDDLPACAHPTLQGSS